MSNTDLDYRFESNILAPTQANLDIESVNRLKQVKDLIQQEIDKYKLITSLDWTDKDFSVEQQLATNNKYVSFLEQLKDNIEETLGDG